MAIPQFSDPRMTFSGLGKMVGGAIDYLGNKRNPNAQSYSSLPFVGNVDVSKTFQTGGLVRPAYASTGPQASSGEVLGAQESAPTLSGYYTPNPFAQGKQGFPSSPMASSPTSNSGNPQPIVDTLTNSAQSQTDVARQSAENEFGKLSDTYRGQLSDLDTQKSGVLSELEAQKQGLLSQVDRSRQQAKADTENQIQQAGNTARTIQSKNRNILRSLGILNSTYAGEQLNQPMEEFGKQRAMLTEALTSRYTELDDFMNQKASEFANYAKSIQDQYTKLSSDIMRDLRYNEADKADAINQLNAALQQRIAEIQTANSQYQQQVEAQKAQTAAYIQSLNEYQNPTANLDAISSQLLSGNVTPKSSTASIYDKKKLSTLS